VWNYSGTAVNEVRNFQYLNFIFPTTQVTPVLTVNSGAVLGSGTIGSTPVTGVNTMGGTDPLKPGDTVTLISCAVTGTLEVVARALRTTYQTRNHLSFIEEVKMVCG
ncbi:MAG: hypothetical protein LBV07_01115, partial [Syntrophobacterales bacterium]|jgi:hypothetical protein|nr:hypothetical protein [Syntrophobacterales bacterium]